MLAALLVCAAPAAAQPRAEDESTALVDEGRGALRDNKLDDAARALDQAIALNPRRIEAYVLRGAVHLARKEYAAGVALLQQARALAPDNVDVLATLGTLLMYADRGDEGALLLETVIAREPRRYEARALLGKHHAARGEWAAAATDLEAYLAARPAGLAVEDPAYRIELADAYLRSRKPDKARALFAKALTARPHDVRGRVGLAWATAAIDCGKARPLLAALADVAARVPAIGLVDGRCALALGDVDAALAAGRRYLAIAPGEASGHGLVGDALLARGDAAGARDAYAQAQALEPKARRWAVRRAGALRKSGDPAGAVAALDQLGMPAHPADDPAWWRELALALVAERRFADAVDRVGPVAATLDDASVFASLGEAELGRAHPELAVPWLEQAHGKGAGDDVTALLARALGATGAAKLRADDLAGAEADLVRATGLPGPASAAALRNLGIARLAAGKHELAVTALDAAIAVAPDAATWMLRARAKAALGDAAAARASYAKARAVAKGGEAVDVAIEIASFELAAGDAAAAVAALEAATPSGDAIARHKAALETARHAAGLAALRAGQVAKAIALFDAAAKDAGGDEARAVACDRALASVAGGDRDLALRQLRALGTAPCPFPAPADVQAVPILTALNDGLRPRRAEAALAKLATLQRSATGAARALVVTAVRVVALRAADDAYRAGDLKKATRYLASARTVESRLGADELAHNQAVVELASGRTAAAIPVLERLAGRVPEALVNLGIAYDRQGEPQKALEAWRRARKAGVGFAALGDWIAAKERIYGAEVTP
ncbi:MAG: tetratricopeptide repeat protein [Deltaproteobacteria bacterium]|nr:tetratricopeptide repeat protein [Deltaproteobacteria bacterium]